MGIALQLFVDLSRSLSQHAAQPPDASLAKSLIDEVKAARPELIEIQDPTNTHTPVVGAYALALGLERQRRQRQAAYRSSDLAALDEQGLLLSNTLGWTLSRVLTPSVMQNLSIEQAQMVRYAQTVNQAYLDGVQAEPSAPSVSSPSSGSPSGVLIASLQSAPAASDSFPPLADATILSIKPTAPTQPALRTLARRPSHQPLSALPEAHPDRPVEAPVFMEDLLSSVAADVSPEDPQAEAGPRLDPLRPPPIHGEVRIRSVAASNLLRTPEDAVSVTPKTLSDPSHGDWGHPIVRPRRSGTPSEGLIRVTGHDASQSPNGFSVQRPPTAAHSLPVILGMALTSVLIPPTALFWWVFCWNRTRPSLGLIMLALGLLGWALYHHAAS